MYINLEWNASLFQYNLSGSHTFDIHEWKSWSNRGICNPYGKQKRYEILI